MKVVNHGFQSGCIDIDFKYDLEPFALCMKINHSFTNHTITLQQLQITHSYFELVISGFKRTTKSTNFSHYQGHLILREIKNKSKPNTSNIRICRSISLSFSLSLDDSNMYLLSIDINGPSLLSDRHLKLLNLIDLQSVLKYSFRTTVLWQYNLFFTDGLISIIFDVFLSKYCWSFPPSSIYPSPKLNINNIKQNIPNGTEHLDPGFMTDTLPNTDDILIPYLYDDVFAYYVAMNKLDKLIPCKINGIAVNVRILGETTNIEDYCGLFDLFRYYQIEEPELSTIFKPQISSLYKLKHLCNGLDTYISIFPSLNDIDIVIDVRLLLDIDANIKDDEILMIVTEWEYDHRIFYVERQFLYKNSMEDDDGHFGEMMGRFHVEQSQFHRKFGNDKKYLENMKIAAIEYCHSDFNKSVECYKDMMEELSLYDIANVIYKDVNHFGEAILALYRLNECNELVKMICAERRINCQKDNIKHFGAKRLKKLDRRRRYKRYRDRQNGKKFDCKRYCNKRFLYNRW